jgi:hypothetical protein
LQPIHRGEIYEDPLDEKLQELSLGTVTGGGTLCDEDGEIMSCDIEVEIGDSSPSTIGAIKTILEDLGAPKGSQLIVHSTNTSIPIGVGEGLAVYLNGTDLPDQIYKECDSNFVLAELNRLSKGAGAVHSFWQGPTETAFYLYGPNAEAIERLIREFLDSYPLCQKCRVEEIA